MARSKRMRRKRIIVPHLDEWASWADTPTRLEEPELAAPAGVARLSHQRPTTLAIAVTPDAFGPAGAIWSTGAGVGSGAHPGWQLGLNALSVWFSVEQSGGVRPARVAARIFRTVRYGEPLVLVARHANHLIELNVNGQSSGWVPVDGYGRIESNEDSIIGGLAGFSDEHTIPGVYHRWGVLHELLDDRQVEVVTATWLAHVGSAT